MDQPPASLPASPLLQLTHSPESALDIAAHLLEQPDIPLEDGLLNRGDLQADFRVVFGWAWVSSSVIERRPGPVQLLPGPGDSNDFDPATALPERLPEFAVRRTPGAERGRGLVARIDMDEDGALDGQFEREAGINLRKSRWDNDLATRYGLRVSPGVSEGRKSRYPLGLWEKHAETERSGGSVAARSRAET